MEVSPELLETHQKLSVELVSLAARLEDAGDQRAGSLLLFAEVCRRSGRLGFDALGRIVVECATESGRLISAMREPPASPPAPVAPTPEPR